MIKKPKDPVFVQVWLRRADHAAIVAALDYVIEAGESADGAGDIGVADIEAARQALSRVRGWLS